MTPLTHWLELPEASFVGWWILHSLWQGAVIGGAFALVRCGLRKHSAASRYVAGCAALFILVLAPLLTVAVLDHLNHPQPPDPSQAHESAMKPSVYSGSQSAGARGELSFVAGGKILTQIAPHLSIYWVLGVMLCSIRLGRSYWCVHKLRSSDKRPVALSWVAMMERLSVRLQIARPVRLFESSLVDVPTVLGWLRPVILLPAATLAGLSPQQVEAILAHELAHVRRCDYLINACQCFIETLMFYHPIVWWISRCIRDEREHCCDDLALEVCSNRLTYARALASLETFRVDVPHIALAATGGGTLLGRIQRLLAVPVARPTTFRQLAGLLLIICGLLSLLLGSCLLLARAQFTAVARIRLPSNVQTVRGENSRAISQIDPHFLKMELEVIRSDFILRRVAANLNLVARWNSGRSEDFTTNQAVSLLRRRLDLRAIGNSWFIEVRAAGTDPNEAAQLANAVAVAYRDYCQESAKQLSQRGIESLEERFREQEERVRRKQAEVDGWREKLQIPESLAQEQPTPPHTAEMLTRLYQLRVEAKSQVVGEETMLKQLKALSSEQAIAAMPTAMPDVLLASLMEQKNRAEQSLLAVRIDYAQEHPEFIKASSQLKYLNEKITKRVEGILIGLEKRVDANKERLRELEEEIQKAGERDMVRDEKWRPYHDAKRELEELQRFRQIMNLKIASERIDGSLPVSGSLVQIVDVAVPPSRANAPSRRHGFALCLLGFLCNVSGLVLLRTKSS